MVRCIDFYEKWAKEPNFCDKCAASVNNIDRYMALIEDVAKEFPDYGTKEDFYLILPEGRTPYTEA